MGWRTMTLRRSDGRVYLRRWGFGSKRFGSVYLHRMDAPDPGDDLHDHPWQFVSVVLAGSYGEQRVDIRDASPRARAALMGEGWEHRGYAEVRRRWSVRRMRLDECHRVVHVYGRRCWTLVFCGPVRRQWGFYTPAGWVDQHTYDYTRDRPLREENVR